MIDYGLFMMIYKPSKLIYSSVHIDLVYHFIRDHFSRIPIYTYISFNRPVLTSSLSTVPSSLSLRTSSSLLSTLSMALWQHLPLALDHNFFITINVLPEVVSDPQSTSPWPFSDCCWTACWWKLTKQIGCPLSWCRERGPGNGNEKPRVSCCSAFNGFEVGKLFWPRPGKNIWKSFFKFHQHLVAYRTEPLQLFSSKEIEHIHWAGKSQIPPVEIHRSSSGFWPMSIECRF